MDDYNISSLTESKNEWCARLVNILTPEVIHGLKSIFSEAWKLCQDNDETDKYLMTFQTFLSRVPKWNSEIIENERKRIVESSGCLYLEDLITAVHIIQLKALSCVRVGQKQKKIDINIPSVDNFIHKVYINVARKIYTNVYLFEKLNNPLQIQKHNRELEMIIRECILNSVRESVPVEHILRAYMDETSEQHVEVKEIEEQIPLPPEPIQENIVQSGGNNETHSSMPISTQAPLPETQSQELNIATQRGITFNDVDKAIDIMGNEIEQHVPKTIEHLETLSIAKRGADNNDSDDDRLHIGDDDVSLDIADINDLNRPMVLEAPPILDDIEILG